MAIHYCYRQSLQTQAKTLTAISVFGGLRLLIQCRSNSFDVVESAGI
jgi:hypothetical protein